MAHLGKETKSFRKVELDNQRVANAPRRITFAHKATAGQTIIDLTALTAPTEMTTNGFANPSAAIVAEAHIKLYRANLQLTSSLRGALIDYLAYTINSPTQIQLVGLYTSTGALGAEEGEIFVGELTLQPTKQQLLVDASSIVASGTLTAGSTDITVGTPFTLNANSTTQVGAVLLVIDGKIQMRNVGNVTAAATADGNYQEVPAVGSLTSLLRMNAASDVDRAYMVISTQGQVERPDGSMMALVEAIAGSVNSMKTTLAEVAGVAESSFGITPSTVDLKVFGDSVLSLLARTTNLEKTTVHARYNTAAGTFSIGGGNRFNPNVVFEDTHNAVTVGATTWAFTAPRDDYYDVHANFLIHSSSPALSAMYLRTVGSGLATPAHWISNPMVLNNQCHGSSCVFLKKGDQIFIDNGSGTATTIGNDAPSNWIAIISRNKF